MTDRATIDSEDFAELARLQMKYGYCIEPDCGCKIYIAGEGFVGAENYCADCIADRDADDSGPVAEEDQLAETPANWPMFTKPA